MSLDKLNEQLEALHEEERKNIKEAMEIWVSLPQEYRTKILLNVHNVKQAHEDSHKPWLPYNHF